MSDISTTVRKGTALAGIAAATLGLQLAAAEAQAPKDLTVLGLEVHQHNLRATGFARGGVDTLAALEKETNSRIVFNTGTTTSLQESLQRLGVLSRTDEDVIYVNQLDANIRVKTFLAPLNDFIARKPIEGYPKQWPPGVIAASTFDNGLYLLPVRCGTFTLWYNTQLMSERGIPGTPKTPEELLDYARKGTFTRPSGEKVFGFTSRGDKWSITEDLAVLARMYGGDLIGANMEVLINKAGAVKAVQLLQTMYAEGLMPPNWTSIDGTALQQLFRDARLTLTVAGANYGSQVNNDQSKVKGIAFPAHMPLARELWTDKITYSPSVIWFWGVSILKGSTDKDLAYDLIRHIGRQDVQTEMAKNGNGPCTLDVLDERAKVDAAMKLTQEIFAISWPPIPSHPRMNQVRDLIGETVQTIVVNKLDAQKELDAVAERIRRILG